ncbi:hypothetical protein HW115_03430 [Verrucomicrobiaceae bacterium N1E253]|uniref:Uncharacterized protein n=1 Tax=Oceaniferula marina TaxID=2748318 RepID=A0A851GHP0_9BACT|nr:hypothetical protein [Oceaniferula marina]NWK54647.1 hypothetical protein [Oceaniferula marina]
MSDGQSFYLLLLLLYLSSCIKVSARGCQGVVKTAWGSWRLRPSVASLGGIRKDLFIAPLLPWPPVLILAKGTAEVQLQRRGSQASLLRLTRLIVRASADLRLMSLGVFLTFFVLVPYRYHLEGGSPRVMYTLAVGFILMFAAWLRYSSLHRRLWPKQKAERFKHLFLSMTMPWHAMRLADELLLVSPISGLHPLAAVSLVEGAKGRCVLGKALRESIYLDHASYKEDDLRRLYGLLGVDAESLLMPPDRESGGEHYCPCCHEVYSQAVDVCSDCKETSLLRFEADGK